MAEYRELTKNQVRISVVVPVYNSSKYLVECLSALNASSYPDREIIVVDDGSTDDSPFVAARMGARVLRLKKNSGPATARNYGACRGQGEIVLFVDADVVVASTLVSRVASIFQEQPDLAAVFGSYDARPKAEGVISQYRNLLHHFVHQNGNPAASTFWAGCGAIRRSVFEEIGGFDEKRYSQSSIEDIELGYRLRQSGYRILLDKTLQATHLKRWSLYSLVRTDIMRRAIPWSRLILETKNIPDDLNLKLGQRASFVLVVMACISLALGVFQVESIAISASALLGVLVLNRRLYLFFLRQRGFSFTLACVPLHILYYLYSGLSYLYVRTGFLLRSLVSF